MAEIINTDVLIVGGGIAGPALACALSNSGLSITLIEKSDKEVDTARGDHLRPGTLDILQRWGVLQDFIDNGAEKRLGTGWYQRDGSRVLETWLKDLDIPHPYFFFLNHEQISKTLLQAAARNERFRLIKPIRHWRLLDETPTATTVQVSLRNGEELHIQASLLVGADGSGSHVRKVSGIEAEVYRYKTPIAVLFGRCQNDNPGNPLRVYLSGSKIVSVIPRTGGVCKMGIPLSLAELKSWRSADQAEVQRRVQELVPAPGLDDVRFSAVYPPLSLTTDRWVKNNVVLLGDACHAMHPARSQGMNTAIYCVDELVKRLPLVNGALEPSGVRQALLDYQAAVKPAIDELVESNHQSGLEMDNPEQADYQQLATTLKQVHENPQAHKAYAMNMAGY
jgi:3-(3-hydroxy-phenyl)propionate hydroxylase